MKGNLKAIAASGVLVLSLVAAAPTAVFATEASSGSPLTIEGYATPDSVDEVKDADGNAIENWSESDIPVSAEVIGSSDKIIYSVRVDYGDMNFSYDFGQTWDPETHTYSVNKTDQVSGGWVVKKCIDGKNNAIKITNNSNYPIHADFSYKQVSASGGGTLFNASLNKKNNVVGIFSDNNDTLASNINDEAYNGLHATSVDALMTCAFDLDMDYSNLTIGQYVDYGVLPDSNANYTKFDKTIYFALCGTPDSSVTFTDGYVPVGTIKLKITPVPKAQTVMRNTLPQQ